MGKFISSEAGRVALSALAAVTLTGVSVLAAAAPAKATAPAPLGTWHDVVQHQIEMLPPEQYRYQPSQLRVADVVTHFGADGAFAGATLGRTSGDNAIDRRAVRIAQGLRYPRLPAAMLGQARDITVRLRFGDGSQIAPDEAPAGRVELARAAKRGEQLAAR